MGKAILYVPTDYVEPEVTSCMIRIISGTYGYYDENGKLSPKDKYSEPFIVGSKEAARLVEAGVAEYVEDPVATLSEEPDATDPSENPSGDETAETGDDEPVDTAVLDENTPMNTLRQIAADRGIKVKVGMKKAELLDALNGDDEEEPDLNAESPV